MKIDRRSLAYRLLVPIFAVTLVITVAILLVVGQITRRITEDYHHRITVIQAEEINQLLDAAIAELTEARLADNPTVVEAKKHALLDAIAISWKRTGIGGIVEAEDKSILRTTFSPELTRRILASKGNGIMMLDEGEIHINFIYFQPWNWRLVTVFHAAGYHLAHREILLLGPLVFFGFLSLGAALFSIFRRNLQQPVAGLAAAMARAEPVRSSGVTELDKMGRAFNDSLECVKEHSAALVREHIERERAEEAIREHRRTEEAARERERAEKETRKREAQILLFLQSAEEGFYAVDTAGVCTFANLSCSQLLGYAGPEELLGKSMHTLIHHTLPDGRPFSREKCRILQAYHTGKVDHVDDEVFWRADGTSFPVEYWVHPIFEDNVLTGAVVAFFDITSRKRAEETLLAEKNKFETIVAAMGDIVTIQDREFTIIYQNAVQEGIVDNQMGEKCFRAYRCSNEVCAGCPMVLCFSDGGIHTAHLTIRQPEGIRHIEVTAAPLRDGSGAIVAGIEIKRDITGRVRVEEQLHHAQKMESIGHLAGGVAHDFNNLLSVIQGYSELLRQHLFGNETLLEYVNQIQATIGRGAAITRQILAFSRSQAITITPVNLGELINGIQQMLRRLVRENIIMEFDLPEIPFVVAANASQLDQVLLNLASNAAHAMPDGGAIRIGLSHFCMDDRFVSTHGYGSPGEYALLTFADTGIGMEENVRKRIFEPFFTTREAGMGTGLGLAMVYGIVTKHNGYINVYSEPGLGTIFKIFLPLQQETATTETRSMAEKYASIPCGTETILIAEDDDNLRLLVRTLLEMANYKVIETKDGDDALQQFIENKERIGLVLLDGIMPKKNGKEALIAMRAVCPEIKAIILSGYAEEVFIGENHTGISATFLQKPIPPDQLLRELRNVLDGNG